MIIRRRASLLWPAAVAAIALFLLPGHLTAQQPDRMNSGATVQEFLAALDRGEIDAAMAKWTPNPEVALHTGEVYTSVEEVRAYFERFPRPVEIVAVLPWGGRRIEARVLAGGEPLLLTLQGADGAIAYMYVEPDPT
jgi:hypothetical protein